ncbi:MAG TPA: LysE family translocator [Jiangellaceae bacterium]|nr:LysE family translocator [Jiangellaceae bacterium]
MTPSDIAAFIVAVALLAMVPGPATALIVRRSAVYGTRAALPVVAGIELGIYLWAIAAAVGLAAVVAASEAAYVVLRIVGACVLIVLGVQAWRAARHAEDAATPTSIGTRGWRWSAGAGVLTNLANPKAAVFAFAFYPQFIPAGADVLATTMLLGVLQVVVDATWYVMLALLVGRARDFFSRAAVRRRLERITGTVLIGLGIRLAADRA